MATEKNMKTIEYILLTFKFKKEQNKWTAFCDELGTATFADTFEEAVERIKEAVPLFLNTLEDVGERENFFKTHNIKTYKHRPKHHLTCSGHEDANTYYGPYIQPIQKELLSI